MATSNGCTPTHALDNINSEMKTGANKIVSVTRTSKATTSLELYVGSFMNPRLVPSTGITINHMCSAEDIQPCYFTDVFDLEDWKFCKDRVSSLQDKKQIDNLLLAHKLCDQADDTRYQNPFSIPKRRSLYNQAIKTSPDLCSRAHAMLFDLIERELGSVPPNNKQSKTLAKAAKEAVRTGRTFANLIRAYQFAKGDLHSFVPTRWYIRSLYLLGSHLLYTGDLKGADKYLSECLANDIHDTLGARHKQLLVALSREKGLRDDQLPNLLKAKFGNDQKQDDVLALWNYTRALYTFAKKGRCAKSDKLLALAIQKNPHVVPLVLAWEIRKVPHMLMQIGHETEAWDYIDDNHDHWLSVEGALEWVEKIYCQERSSVIPPPTTTEGKKLLVEGSIMMESKDATRSSQRQAIEKIDRVLGMMERTDTSKAFRSKMFQRMAVTHWRLSEHDIALRKLTSALCLCELTTPAGKEWFRTLIYLRADFKEASGDLSGSLKDNQFIINTFGNMKSALDGIQRIRTRLSLDPKASLRAPEPDIGVDESMEEVTKMLQRYVSLLPPIDPQETVASNLERCSHCQRGGIKLSLCAACGDALYCSKSCQKTAWSAMHKYVCKGSKHRLEAGDRIRLDRLKKTPEHNGKIGTVVRFLQDKGRFTVELPDENGGAPAKMNVKPTNLDKLSTGKN